LTDYLSPTSESQPRAPAQHCVSELERGREKKKNERTYVSQNLSRKEHMAYACGSRSRLTTSSCAGDKMGKKRRLASAGQEGENCAHAKHVQSPKLALHRNCAHAKHTRPRLAVGSHTLFRVELFLFLVGLLPCICHPLGLAVFSGYLSHQILSTPFQISQVLRLLLESVQSHLQSDP